MLYEYIDEPIEVFADFTQKGPVPLSFTWKNTTHKIKRVDFAYTSKAGDTKLFNFSVSTDTEVYKITFNPQNMSWKLEEIYLDTNFKTATNLNDSTKKNNNAYRLR